MRNTKYRNRKVKKCGIWFDSQLEADRYVDLLIMQRAGAIIDLVVHPKFELIPPFNKNGKHFRKTTYSADFMYTVVRTGKKVIEDTKGFRTDLYRLKRKLFEYNYPDLTITEVTR